MYSWLNFNGLKIYYGENRHKGLGEALKTGYWIHKIRLTQQGTWVKLRLCCTCMGEKSGCCA